jgi:hypothetical protein
MNQLGGPVCDAKRAGGTRAFDVTDIKHNRRRILSCRQLIREVDARVAVRASGNIGKNQVEILPIYRVECLGARQGAGNMRACLLEQARLPDNGSRIVIHPKQPGATDQFGRIRKPPRRRTQLIAV